VRLPRFGGVFLYCRLRRAAGLGVAPSSQQTAPAGMVPELTTDPRSAMAGQRAWPSIQNATVQTADSSNRLARRKFRSVREGRRSRSLQIVASRCQRHSLHHSILRRRLPKCLTYLAELRKRRPGQPGLGRKVNREEKRPSPRGWGHRRDLAAGTPLVGVPWLVP